MEEPYSNSLSRLQRLETAFLETKEIIGIYEPRVKLINTSYIDEGGSEC